jgi:hypothetical protein
MLRAGLPDVVGPWHHGYNNTGRAVPARAWILPYCASTCALRMPRLQSGPHPGKPSRPSRPTHGCPSRPPLRNQTQPERHSRPSHAFQRAWPSTSPKRCMQTYEAPRHASVLRLYCSPLTVSQRQVVLATAFRLPSLAMCASRRPKSRIDETDTSPLHPTNRALVWMRDLRRAVVLKRAQSTAMDGQHSPRLSLRVCRAERLSACQIPVHGASVIQNASHAPLVGCRFKRGLRRARDDSRHPW